MAGDAIKYTDLVESNALPKIITEFEGITIAIEQTNKELVKTASLMKTALNSPATNAEQAEQIRKLILEVEKLSKAHSENKKVLKETTVEIEKAKIVNSEYNKTQKELAKNELGLTSEYSKQSKVLNDLRHQYKDLALTNKANTVEAKALLTQIQALDTKLKEVDATTGQHQRNVGNYVGAVQKLYSGLKTAANIIPGLGISGIILAGYEIVSGLVTEIASGIHQSVEGTKEWNDVTGDMLGNFKTLLDDYKKSVIEGDVLNGKLTESEGKIAFARIDANNAVKASQEEYNKAVEKANKLAEDETAKRITKTTYLTKDALGIKAIEIDIEKQKQAQIAQAASIAASDLKLIQAKLKQDIRNINKDADNKEEADAKKKKEKIKKEKDKPEEWYNSIDQQANLRARALENTKKVNDEIEKERQRVEENYDTFKARALANTKKRNAEDEAEATRIEDNFANFRARALANTKLHNAELKKERDKEKQDEIKRLSEMLKIMDEYEKKVSDIKLKAIEGDIKRNESAIEVQTALAANGYDNTLQYELKKQDELDKARQENLEKQKQDAKRKEQIELGIAFYSAYAKAMEKPNETIPQALAEAATGVFAAKAFGAALASYFVGTEDTGNGGDIDNKKGFLSVLHPHERVINAEDNKALLDAGLTNKDVVRNALAVDRLTLSDVSHSQQVNSSINSMLVAEIRDLKRVIKDKTENHIELSRTGDVIKTTVAGEYRKQTTFKTHLS